MKFWFKFMYTFYSEIVIRMATKKDQIYYRSAQGLQGSPTTGGHGFIWLDRLRCAGTETSLSTCRRQYDIGYHYCTHSEDARAVCHDN